MAKRGLVALRERSRLKRPEAADVKTWVEIVRRDGVCVVPGFYDPKTCGNLCDEVTNLLRSYPAAVHSMSSGSDLRIFGAEQGAEGIRLFAKDTRLLNAAQTLLAGDAANAFTLAGAISYREGNLGSGEGWHRDSFFNQFKSIVYLTDVTDRNGPFEYIRQSHLTRRKFADHAKFDIPLKSARIADGTVGSLIAAEPERHRVFTASMGTLLLVDTTGIHRGMPLKEGERFALTNYYFPGKALKPELFEHFSPVLGREVHLHV